MQPSPCPSRANLEKFRMAGLGIRGLRESIGMVYDLCMAVIVLFEWG